MILAERLAGFDLFRELPPVAISALARRAIEVTLEPNEVAFLAGAAPRGWWIVLEGRVRVMRGEGTRQHVVHTEGPGGTLGEVPMFGDGTHPATGIAAEPCRCALLTRPALEGAIAEAPVLAFTIARCLAHRVRHLVDRLDERSSRSVQARVVEFLLARPIHGNSSISLGLTQQALSEELGTVREVVSRELRALKASGLIESLGGGRYTIPDVPKLRLLAEHDGVVRAGPVTFVPAQTAPVA